MTREEIVAARVSIGLDRYACLIKEGREQARITLLPRDLDDLQPICAGMTREQRTDVTLAREAVYEGLEAKRRIDGNFRGDVHSRLARLDEIGFFGMLDICEEEIGFFGLLDICEGKASK